jgi:Exo-beta-D-glucosaminidase Ig-fold domain
MTASGLVIHAKVYSLDNKVLAEHEEKKDAPTGVIEAFSLDLGEQLKRDVAFVKLELRDSSGKLVSDNFYWVSGDTADYRKLNRLPAAQMAVTANVERKTRTVNVHVRLENKENSAAIETKLTLLESDGRTRILPAYYADNYISLLPGEIREVDVETPSSAVKTGVTLGVRGWNVNESLLKIGGEK